MSSPGPVSSKLVRPAGSQVATFAIGCFWGSHAWVKHLGNGRGLIDNRVGYTGGNDNSTAPTYQQVCTGNTNHAEAIQVSFDPTVLPYEKLVDFFFHIHDPTQLNQQGPDRGTQYRSAIFYHNDEQKEIAEKVKDHLQKTFWKNKIVTDIKPIGTFWDAEDYHQNYLDKNPNGYECPAHYLRTKPQI